jgi:hypothetical protein
MEPLYARRYGLLHHTIPNGSKAVRRVWLTASVADQRAAYLRLKFLRALHDGA